MHTLYGDIFGTGDLEERIVFQADGFLTLRVRRLAARAITAASPWKVSKEGHIDQLIECRIEIIRMIENIQPVGDLIKISEKVVMLIREKEWDSFCTSVIVNGSRSRLCLIKRECCEGRLSSIALSHGYKVQVDRV